MATIADLIEHLERFVQDEHCDLAFDGDGTLWSGDVSDDVFLTACASDWFHESLRPHVSNILNEHGLEAEGTIGTLTRRVFDAEKRGGIEERLLFEFMTWCYCGRTDAEVSTFAARILQRAGIDARIRRELIPLLNWARSSGHDCWLVTASPLPIVKVVATALGFGERHIVASCPVISTSGCIGTGVAAPVPYREQKVQQLNARRSHPRLLAAFGDSPFDLELLRAAEVAVAVNPKPQLARLLPGLGHAWLLNLSPSGL